MGSRRHHGQEKSNARSQKSPKGTSGQGGQGEKASQGGQKGEKARCRKTCKGPEGGEALKAGRPENEAEGSRWKTLIRSLALPQRRRPSYVKFRGGNRGFKARLELYTYSVGEILFDTLEDNEKWDG